MRYLNPDKDYFDYLDELRKSQGVNIVLAPGLLMREFPNLRSEEAKAICTDWRLTYRERHGFPSIR